MKSNDIGLRQIVIFLKKIRYYLAGVLLVFITLSAGLYILKPEGYIVNGVMNTFDIHARVSQFTDIHNNFYRDFIPAPSKVLFDYVRQEYPEFSLPEKGFRVFVFTFLTTKDYEYYYDFYNMRWYKNRSDFFKGKYEKLQNLKFRFKICKSSIIGYEGHTALNNIEQVSVSVQGNDKKTLEKDMELLQAFLKENLAERVFEKALQRYRLFLSSVKGALLLKVREIDTGQIVKGYTKESLTKIIDEVLTLQLHTKDLVNSKQVQVKLASQGVPDFVKERLLSFVNMKEDLVTLIKFEKLDLNKKKFEMKSVLVFIPLLLVVLITLILIKRRDEITGQNR